MSNPKTQENARYPGLQQRRSPLGSLACALSLTLSVGCQSTDNSEASPPAPQSASQAPSQLKTQDMIRNEVIVRFDDSVSNSLLGAPNNGLRVAISAQLPAFDAVSRQHGALRMRHVFKKMTAITRGALSSAAAQKRERIEAGTILVQVADTDDIRSVVAKFAALPGVEFAQPNYIYQPDKMIDLIVPGSGQDGDSVADQSVESDADAYVAKFYDAESQWSHVATEMEQAWAVTTGDPDIVVAVLGVGVQIDHEDLDANIWVNQAELDGTDANAYVGDVNGWNFFEADENGGTSDVGPYFRYGAPSSPSTGNDHETAAAGIIVAEDNGLGIVGVAPDCRVMPLTISYDSVSVAAALQYATDMGARVVNMSFGNYSLGADKYAVDTLVEDEVEDAYNAGIVLVATAGNLYRSDPRYPAALEQVIAVGSTDSEDQRSSFSGFGEWVTVSAPGTSVRTTSQISGGYAPASGTSFAAPYVAGLAALILSKDPSLSPDSVRRRIEYTADPINMDMYIGSGRVNARRALEIDVDPSHVAQISTPFNTAALEDIVKVRGRAMGDSYSLEYRASGESDWILAGSGTNSDTYNLAEIDVSEFAVGTYELRLQVIDGGVTKTSESTLHIDEKEPAHEWIGKNFNGFVVTDIDFQTAPPGNYTFHIEDPTAGYVELRKDGVKVSSTEYDWMAKVYAPYDRYHPTVPRTFDFPGYITIILKNGNTGSKSLYGLNTSVFDGVQTLAPPGNPTLLLEGHEYGNYNVRMIEPLGAPRGNYELDVPSAGLVSLWLNDEIVASAEFDPTTVIDKDAPYSFEFPGYFNLLLATPSSKDRTLEGLSENILSRRQAIRIDGPEDEFNYWGMADANGLRARELLDLGAQPGLYTFEVDSDNYGLVTLFRDGLRVGSSRYKPSTTVGGTNSELFGPVDVEFPGYFVLRVSRSTSGTSNLIPLAGGLFNGETTLNVDVPPVPTAELQFSCTGLICDFGHVDGSQPSPIVSQYWDFGDGHTTDEVNPIKVFDASGSYTVTVTVTNQLGGTASDTKLVEVEVPNSCDPAQIIAEEDFESDLSAW